MTGAATEPGGAGRRTEDFLMPSLGADMDAGTVVEWLVAPGDSVSRGQVVAVVDTAKAAIEIEVFVAGEVAELLVPVGTKVPVGTPLARILLAAGGGPAAPVPVRDGSPPTAPAAEPLHPPLRHLAHTLGVDLVQVRGTGRGGAVTRADVVSAGEREPGVRRRVTPRARRLAAASGVDLAGLRAAHDGVLTGDDVSRAIGPPPPAQEVTDRHEAVRHAIGVLMARSKREIPHYYVSRTLDVTSTLTWLAARNADRQVGERVLPAAVWLRGIVLACRAVPDLNGEWRDGRAVPSDAVHLGVAVSRRGGGLVTPVLRDAQALGLDALMVRLADLVARARRGRLRQSEMVGATITVSDLGDEGADLLAGIIFPPQLALVGLGRVVERPWAVRGMLAVRSTLTATLAADHRATDGRQGARFLAAVAHSLADPGSLVGEAHDAG